MAYLTFQSSCKVITQSDIIDDDINLFSLRLSISSVRKFNYRAVFHGVISPLIEKLCMRTSQLIELNEICGT